MFDFGGLFVGFGVLVVARIFGVEEEQQWRWQEAWEERF